MDIWVRLIQETAQSLEGYDINIMYAVLLTDTDFIKYGILLEIDVKKERTSVYFLFGLH